MAADGLPSRWRNGRLGDIAVILMGQAPPGTVVVDWHDGKAPADVGLPFIQGNAEFTATHPRPTKWCLAPIRIAESGDSLISVRAPVGELNRADRRLAIGRGLAAVRFTGADVRYGWYLLGVARKALGRVAQGSTFEAVNLQDLRSLAVRIAPRDQQSAIADVLSAIDSAIDKTEAVVAATEGLRRALLEELLTRGVPGRHNEWKQVQGIGTIPACWSVVRLGDLLSRAQYGTNLPLLDARMGIAVLRMGNLQNGEVDFGSVKWANMPAAERRGLTIRSGDILFNRTNSIDLVGKISVVRELAFECSFASYLVRLNTKPDRADPFWLNDYLNWQPTQDRIRRLATKGASQANINPTNLRSLAMPCPPLREQQRIAQVLETVRARNRAEREVLSFLQQAKGLIASSLLSGLVRVATKGRLDV